jgi:FkbM family methyltransferase
MRAAFWRARRLAGRLVRAIPEPKNPMEIELRRPWMQALGIRTVIDVGANEGQFAAMVRRIFPSSRILSFEPIEACYGKLRQSRAGDPLFEAFHCALGDEEGVATFHQNDFSPSSSLLAMKDAHKQAFPYTSQERITQVPVRRIDDVLGTRELEGPVLLKLDVQGYEARVLAGARETLKRCHLVLAEVSLESLYEGEPLAHEMVALLAASGYRIAGVADCLRRPSDERPLQMDVIFVRG